MALNIKDYPADPSNYTQGRQNNIISEIVIHHMAAPLTAAQCGSIFQAKGRNGSAHYGVGIDGSIGRYVKETDIAWHASNWAANCRSIGIETSNSSAGGNWPVNDVTLNALIQLVADIAKRHNLGKLVKGKNLTWHQMYAATACVPIDTEVLTLDGWKRIDKIKVDDIIATVNPSTLEIIFDKVYDIVPQRNDVVFTNNGFTATGDHRMLTRGQNSKDYRFELYKDVLDNNSARYIQTAGYFKGEGLNLSDDEIKLLVATQADGHYMHEQLADGSNSKYYGLEFHLKKQRKIDRLLDILTNLELDYTISEKADGSTSIRIQNDDNFNIVNDFCELWLTDKKFNWNWLNLSEAQAKIFLEEIYHWDGCKTGKFYCSNDEINRNVVQAIAAINGVGTGTVNDIKISLNTRPYKTFGLSEKSTTKSNATVACVSVPSGAFLCRQNGKTYITGNCPGPYLLSKIDYIVEQANEINYPTKTPAAAASTKVAPHTSKIDGTNINRGANTLIKYNGRVSTKTNQYGYEIVTDSQNIITSIEENRGNATIPSGGNVFSGHGTAATYLKSLGLKVGNMIWDNAGKVAFSKNKFHKVNNENGIRSANYLCVYDTGKTTNTNPYGYEVCIYGGKAQSNPVYGKGHMTIRENSFVLSGNGLAGDWIKNNIKKGSTVVYNKDKKFVYVK